jgi:protein-tyrosine phosphatase
VSHRFTLIVALDHSNLRNLQAICPKDATATLSLLLDHVPERAGKEVNDPRFGEASGFEVTWEDVTAGARGLIETLRAEQ